MKKTALAALAAVFAVVTACSGNKNDNDSNVASQTDSIIQHTPVDPGEGFTPTTNIRYVDMDSLNMKYNLAKDVQESTIRTYSELEQAQRSRAAEIQRFGAQIEDKMRNNIYLSEQSYQADMQKLQKMQADAQNHLSALQNNAERELAQLNMQLVDSIQSFLVEFNKTRHYDAILIKGMGLYFNPALDITNEVVEGLNARYNKISK